MQRLEELQLSQSYTQLPDYFYARQPITPLDNLRLVSFNEQAARLLDLHPDEARRPDLARFFNSHQLCDGLPIACLYAGHQFGHYVPQLGDGRALLLGEYRHAEYGPWEVQLKGAGETPYSRGGDGRAVLRSTIREYLGSEAMHGLGIPTTRALAIFGSDTPVYRESVEPGALLVRMAPSHVRFGTFQVLYYREQYEDLKRLADYVINHHYPELKEQDKPYRALLQTVVEKTADLVAHWQAVGFAHGVMNTDNMSILGLTLDYGPFGFLDGYDPAHICNHSDYDGRYAFASQPGIARWNCAALAQALLPLMDMEQAKEALSGFEERYYATYSHLMQQKLGLREATDQAKELRKALLQLMADSRVDYSYFFRCLCEFDSKAAQHSLRDMFIERERFDHWATEYRQLLVKENSDDGQRSQEMRRVNPKYILRNYLAQQAIEKAEQGDYSRIEELLTVLQQPYDEHKQYESYAALPPEWASEISVSCSS